MKVKTLVVIPSEPIELYEKKGIYTWLERYYNPSGYFDKVYLLSPLEKKHRFQYGMEIIPVKNGAVFRKLIKEIKPICVRSYGAYWATSFAVINQVKKIPVVASIHDPDPAFIFKGVFKASYIFSMSEHLTTILLDNGVSSNRILNTGNRVDFELFKKYDKSNYNVKAIRDKLPIGRMLLQVGRRTEVKNLITTIRTLYELPVDVFLVIIGQGNEQRVNNEIEALNLSDRIFSIPVVPNNELPLWYNACDVFIAPSLWEGFGVAILEAAACQVKIVTSDIAPINKFLKNDNVNISLIKEYTNPKVLSDAIMNLMESDGWSTETYNFIKKRYSVESIEQLERDFYEKLVLAENKVFFKISTIERLIYGLEHNIVQKFTKFQKRIDKSTKLKKIKIALGLKK